MSQRPLSSMATFFGILAIIGVFMPWHALSVDRPGGAVEIIEFESGLSGQFLGQWTLILACLGTLCLAWFAIFRTKLIVSRGLLLVGALAFGAGALMMIADVLRDLPSRNSYHDGGILEEGKAVGLYLTLAAASIACLATLITFLSPRTVYED